MPGEIKQPETIPGEIKQPETIPGEIKEPGTIPGEIKQPGTITGNTERAEITIVDTLDYSNETYGEWVLANVTDKIQENNVSAIGTSEQLDIANIVFPSDEVDMLDTDTITVLNTQVFTVMEIGSNSGFRIVK